MGQTIKVKLTDAAYAALQRQAQAAGTTPSDEAACSLEQQFTGVSPHGGDELRAARERFERHFGEIDLGYPTGADNPSIDADLAREYLSPHEQT
jgi:hypothetical protein